MQTHDSCDGVSSLVTAKLLERKQKADQKKAQKHKQYVEDIEHQLRYAIMKERTKLPLDNAALDVQHRKDWQTNVLPRAWALKQAGHNKLFRKMENYARKAGRVGVNSRDLLAEHLGWLKAANLKELSDADLVGFG